MSLNTGSFKNIKGVPQSLLNSSIKSDFLVCDEAPIFLITAITFYVHCATVYMLHKKCSENCVVTTLSSNSLHFCLYIFKKATALGPQILCMGMRKIGVFQIYISITIHISRRLSEQLHLIPNFKKPFQK